MRKIIAVAAAVGLATGVSGCAAFKSLAASQKTALITQIVNGVCVATADGIAVAQVDNSIVTNAATGGTGSSTAGALTKASQIGVATCAAINGAIVTLSGTGTVTALAAS